MKKLFSVFLFVTFFTLLFFPSVSGLSLPVIGGVILSGILGGFSGKVGPVVGASWKGIDYMKQYVIPSNPNTSGQQAQRSKMSQAIKNARQVLSTLIADYWSPYAVHMSGFNAFTSELLLTFTGANIFALNTRVAKGVLTPILNLVASYNTGTGALTSVWDANLVGDALGTDTIVFVAYEKSTKDIVGYQDTGTLRSTQAGSMSIATGFTASNVYLYAFAVQGVGASMKISDSIGDVAS
jgi:hypothetical protein